VVWARRPGASKRLDYESLGFDLTFTDVSNADLAALPIDRLGLLVLAHLKATREWNADNFLKKQHEDRRDLATDSVLTEAIGWLYSNNLIASPQPGQSSQTSIIITRAGEEALRGGLGSLKASQRLGVDLHPSLSRIRSQFLLGEFELAAFAAMKQVEIRVRDLANADASLLGTKLMRQAFGTKGVLVDVALDPGERLGLMELFAGAIGTFKNPPSHRQVDYDDPTEASEVVLLADLLLRLLDRTEARLGKT
jgi:uncharacterized protein (TIGR02391 family)